MKNQPSETSCKTCGWNAREKATWMNETFTDRRFGRNSIKKLARSHEWRLLFVNLLPLIDFYFSFCSNCWSCELKISEPTDCTVCHLHCGFLKLRESDSSFFSSRFFRSVCWELRLWALAGSISICSTNWSLERVPFTCAARCLLQPGHKWCCTELYQSAHCLMVWFLLNIFYVLTNVW